MPKGIILDFPTSYFFLIRRAPNPYLPLLYKDLLHRILDEGSIVQFRPLRERASSMFPSWPLVSTNFVGEPRCGHFLEVFFDEVWKSPSRWWRFGLEVLADVERVIAVGIAQVTVEYGDFVGCGRHDDGWRDLVQEKETFTGIARDVMEDDSSMEVEGNRSVQAQLVLGMRDECYMKWTRLNRRYEDSGRLQWMEEEKHGRRKCYGCRGNETPRQVKEGGRRLKCPPRHLQVEVVKEVKGVGR